MKQDNLCCVLISFVGLFAAMFGATPPADAQAPYRIIDLDPGTFQEQGSEPRALLQVGELTFFIASTPGTGKEVWVSDGTADGSRLLVDIQPGPFDSVPRLLGDFGDIVFFAGRGSGGSQQLWRSDGTQAGTFLLTSLQSGSVLRFDSYDVGDDGLFLVIDGDTQSTLWFSDGSVEGTRVLTDQLPSGSTRVVSRGADTGLVDHMGNFWLSDGTADGTLQLLELVRTTAEPELFVADGVFMLVGGETLSSAAQIWTHDGISARQMTAFEPNLDTAFDNLTTREQGLYFHYTDSNSDPAVNDVWLVDADEARKLFSYGSETIARFDVTALVERGEQLISMGLLPGNSLPKLVAVDLETGAPTVLAPEATVSGGLFALGDEVLFEANDPEHSNRLWTSDGTPSGTRPLFDPCLDGEGCFPFLFAMTPGLDGIVFAAGSATHGIELYTSDGSVDGTRRISEFNDPEPFPPHFETDTWLIANDTTAIFAADGLGLGQELWTTHGTMGSTILVANLAQDALASSVRQLAALGDRVLFTACEGGQTIGLWSTGGSEADTTLLQRFPDQDCSTETGSLISTESRVFFTVGEKELWSSDGTALNTGMVYRLPSSCTFGDHMTTLGENLFFVVFAPGVNQIWSSDGVPANTGPFAPFAAFEIQSGYQMVSTADRVFMLIGDVNEEGDLLATDGTAEGSALLQHVSHYSSRDPLQAVALGDFDYVDPGDGLTAIWQSDGTAAGTVEALSSNLAFSSRPRDLTALGDRLIFVAQHSATEDALWSSDIFGEDLVILTTFPVDEGFFEYVSSEAVSRGDRVFFVVDDGVHGREPWVTDGTAAGTHLLRDISPNAVPSEPSQLAVFGDTLFFAASDALGTELWSSDGSSMGTFRVGDIAPGILSSSPQQLVATSDLLYFTADDQLSGRELWATGIAPGICTTGGSTLCLGEGRFRATIHWTDFEGQQGDGQAVSLSDDTGAFWFFESDNLEAMIKVIDGRQSNGHFWVFYGALSNVSFELTVEDLVTTESVTYTNPSGRFASEGDMTALPAASGFAGLGDIEVPKASSVAKTGAGNPFELALGDNGRFVASVEWTDFEGGQGMGTAVPLTDDTGTFWFFGPSNLELMVKVIDGRDFNGNYWVFYGALSNVAFRLTVEDTLTGNVKVYDNSIGTFASRGDVDALPGEP